MTSKLSDLLAALANFDPDCPVEVVHVRTDWQATEPDFNSIPVTISDWKLFADIDIYQDDDGTIKIGCDEVTE